MRMGMWCLGVRSLRLLPLLERVDLTVVALGAFVRQAKPNWEGR